MDCRWADAPPELISDVEQLQRFKDHFSYKYMLLTQPFNLRILVSINNFMRDAALRGWADRFMHKLQIAADIADHAKMLEDAIQSFHVSLLKPLMQCFIGS